MEREEFLIKLGKRIASLRKQHNKSQIDIGAEIQMEKTNLSAIENGRQNPSALTMFKIAKAIGCNIKDFFEKDNL